MSTCEYSDDLYYDSLTTVVGDIYYSNTSIDNKIARFRKLAELIVRKLIKYNPDWKLMLGDHRTIEALHDAGVDEEFFWKAYDVINKNGRESTHSKQIIMPGEQELSVVRKAALDLYAYLLYDFFKRHSFGQDDKIVSAFSLQPARARTLWQLILNNHDNMYVIDKYVLASVKAFGMDGALQIIEEEKETLIRRDVPYTNEYLSGYLLDPLLYAQKITELRKNLYEYLQINIQIEGARYAKIPPLYKTREEAKKYYLQYGILEECTEERKEFNALMSFMYMGWKENEKE